MVSLRNLLPAVVAISNAASCLASSWRFADASVSVQGKGAGVGGGFKEKQAHGISPGFQLTLQQARGA
jgi:hypothetical protein